MASRTISSPINLAAVALAILASAVALLLTEPASAHANLIEASPKPSEELDAPPERVIIWFTEPIEPAFSSIKVLSASGEDVTAGATQFDATEPTAMWVPLATLENGTFTVVWRNVSSVDGHKVTGSFLFAIGEPLGAANQLAVEEQPLLQSPVDPIIRWLIYIGIAVFAGGLFLEFAITTRVARSDEQLAVLEFAQSASTRFAVVALWAIVVVLVAQIAQLALQTAIAFDNASAAVDPARVIDVVSQSDWGRFWSWRFTAAVLAAVTIILARHSRQVFRRSSNDDELDELPLVTETPWGIAAIAFGGVYVLLIALTSHNAATPRRHPTIRNRHRPHPHRLGNHLGRWHRILGRGVTSCNSIWRCIVPHGKPAIRIRILPISYPRHDRPGCIRGSFILDASNRPGSSKQPIRNSSRRQNQHHHRLDRDCDKEQPLSREIQENG